MSITWRSAVWGDIEPCLAIEPRKRGDAFTGAATMDCWRRVVDSPFFASAVLESTPPIAGHRIIGFGASIFVPSAFTDAALVNPQPDINSRVMAGILADEPVLATRREVACANAADGVDVVIMGGFWRDAILSPSQRQEVQTLLPFSFAECLAGYRIRRILYETVTEVETEFAERSVVYRRVAKFPRGRSLFLMTRETVAGVGGSLGTIIFSYRPPVLRLRETEQQLLAAALGGYTDAELAVRLGLRLAAVKARWRSTFERIAGAMPELTDGDDESVGRGMQKRHRVLGYVRGHMEELRPFACE